MGDFCRKAISKGLRFKILTRDRFKCYYCGASSLQVELHIDHMIPIAAGGSGDESNLVAACKDCNLGKSDSCIIPPSHREIEYEDWLVEQMDALEYRTKDLEGDELDEFELEVYSDLSEEDQGRLDEQFLAELKAT